MPMLLPSVHLFEDNKEQEEENHHRWCLVVGFGGGGDAQENLVTKKHAFSWNTSLFLSDCNIQNTHK